MHEAAQNLIIDMTNIFRATCNLPYVHGTDENIINISPTQLTVFIPSRTPCTMRPFRLNSSWPQSFKYSFHSSVLVTSLLPCGFLHVHTTFSTSWKAFTRLAFRVSTSLSISISRTRNPKLGVLTSLKVLCSKEQSKASPVPAVSAY